MQPFYVLVPGLSTEEAPFRAVDVRELVSAHTDLPESAWRIMLSNVDEISAGGSPRSVVAGGIRFVFPGDDRRIDAAGRIRRYPAGTFDLICSDARSPELDPMEIVRLLKPGGVAYYGNWAALAPGKRQLELPDIEARIAGTDAQVEPLVGPWPLRHPIERSEHLAYYGYGGDDDDRIEELAVRASLAKFVIRRLAGGFRDRAGR